MIETLGSKAASQKDPGVPMLEITGITFAGGDLSRPLYPSLIDYSHAPARVQFEPSLQIRGILGEMLRVRFEIDPAAGVRFAENPGIAGEALVTSILAPQYFSPPGLLSAAFVDGDPRRCDLVWDQPAADLKGFGLLNTMRLHCEFESQRSLTPLEEVEGGLYLAILNREEALNDKRVSKAAGSRIDDTVKMLGFDPIGRPRYDLFHAHDSLPAALALEPAFRCREGQIVTFSLALDLPPDVPLMFLTDPPPNADQVSVNGVLPSGHPFQLYQTTVGTFDGFPRRLSTLTWAQETGRQYCATSNPEESRKCYCILGQISGFGLLAAPDGEFAPPSEMASIDPTVIQPPSCTSSGICITP